MNTWVNRYAHLEVPAPGKYYTERINISKSGVQYSKLVKADRSPALFKGKY